MNLQDIAISVVNPDVMYEEVSRGAQTGVPKIFKSKSLSLSDSGRYLLAITSRYYCVYEILDEDTYVTKEGVSYPYYTGRFLAKNYLIDDDLKINQVKWMEQYGFLKLCCYHWIKESYENHRIYYDRDLYESSKSARKEEGGN